MWDLIVSVPDHCLSFYFKSHLARRIISMAVNSCLRNLQYLILT